MRSRCILIAVTSIILIGVLAICLALETPVSQQISKLSSTSSYIDNESGIIFDYPSDWTISKEPNNVTAVIPPWASRRVIYEGYEEVETPYYPFGIRLAPPRNIPGFPAEVSCEDIEDDFSRMDNVALRHFSIPMRDKKAVVAYNIGPDRNGAIAFVKMDNNLYRVEIGRYVVTPNSADDWVAFFTVLFSMKSAPTHSAAIAEGKFRCDY